MNRRWLRATFGSALVFAALFGAAAHFPPRPRLIWNASASVPIGFYRIDVGRHPALGDLVAVAPPPRLETWLAGRGYVPRGIPLLKRVAAMAGALVCRSGVFVTIDGAPAARARTHDRMGRPLPRWLGCRRIARGEVFLLGDAADSLDGRYFGPLPASGLIGTAHPLRLHFASAPPSHPQKEEPDQ